MRLEEIDDTESLNWPDDSSEDGAYEENTEVPSCDSDLDDVPAPDLDDASADDLDNASVKNRDDTAVITVGWKENMRAFCSCGYEQKIYLVERHYDRVHLGSKYYECVKHAQRSVVVFDLI